MLWRSSCTHGTGGPIVFQQGVREAFTRQRAIHRGPDERATGTRGDRMATKGALLEMIRRKRNKMASKDNRNQRARKRGHDRCWVVCSKRKIVEFRIRPNGQGKECLGCGCVALAVPPPPPPPLHVPPSRGSCTSHWSQSKQCRSRNVFSTRFVSKHVNMSTNPRLLQHGVYRIFDSMMRLTRSSSITC
jgi:hypothetical protein